MRKFMYIIGAVAIILSACTKDKFNGSAPEIVLDSESLEAIIDADLNISGIITAENGISEFSIRNEAYAIDRVSSFPSGGQPAEYAFTCDFSVPSGLTEDETIVIHVTDAAGMTATKEVPVKFLKDISDPVVTLASDSFTVYCNAESGKGTCIVSLTAEDDQEFDRVSFNCAALGLDYSEILYGSEVEFSYEIADITDGDYEVLVSVYDKTGNHTDKTLSIKAVTDTQAPAISIESPADGLELTIDDQTGKVSCSFKATVSDDVALQALQVYLIAPDWSVVYSSETIGLSGKTTEAVERTFEFSTSGSYAIYYYLNDCSTSVQSWGNAIEGTICFTVVTNDNDAPEIVMNSASSCRLGDTYTLSLTISDRTGIAECWPWIKVYNENGTEPTEIKNNWSGWWPTVSGTECTVSQTLTFTEEGNYKVYIPEITDLAGNSTEAKEWFTIVVSSAE
ncbi:MAG: hypothetical protein ACI3ZS_03870 [Candidatus Cryptobacteroides sp.]